MTGQEDKLCFNENGAKNQECCLSLLLVSRGRHQSQGEPVAKTSTCTTGQLGGGLATATLNRVKAKAPAKRGDLQQGSPPTVVPARQF